MIVNAIKIDDPAEREGVIETYEQMMRALANAYVPSYGTSYDCLGDEEAFALKYSGSSRSTSSPTSSRSSTTCSATAAS